MSEAEPQHEVTRLIQAASGSDRVAADQLLALVYDQLRKIAQQRMTDERAGHTLQATALVHEAYLRLVGTNEVPWQGRGHFFAAAAEAMRRILVEHARSRGRVKRGGGEQNGQECCGQSDTHLFLFSVRESFEVQFFQRGVASAGAAGDAAASDSTRSRVAS